MEELQDAIEDVQYLQAVKSKDSGPSPTEPWPFPSEKALEDFNTERLQQDPNCFSLETICAGILGLYLFGTFCAERKELGKYDFILDVIRYRRLRTSNLRQRFAQEVIQKFLGDVAALPEEVDVLVDKAPLQRENTTSACLVELERVRSEIRTDGSVGANRLGAVGSVVERLASVLLAQLFSIFQLQPTARAGFRVDSIGVVAGSSHGHDDGNKSGKFSQVNTADMSEADNDENPDVVDVVIERKELEKGALVKGVEQKELVEGTLANGVEREKPVERTAASGRCNDEVDGGEVLHLPVETVVMNRAQESGKCQTGTVGMIRPLSTMEEKIPTDLFDILEAWVFEHLRGKLHADFLISSHFQEYTRFLHVQHRHVTENDFILFRVLGRGGFGAVNGCKRGASGKLFAMKVMNKRRIKIRQSEDLCLNERRILEALGSPFVVSLKYAFESKNDLFLILDLMTGGDLGFHLQQLGRFTPVMAQYYSARTVLGIRHLHQKGIVYRDLKPENVMLDEYGRSKISDMGLACKVTPYLTGACGTRGYWAPEMRLRNAAGKRVPYNECVDWFSLGCILYEFLRGMSPFRTDRAIEWCADKVQDKEKRVDKATLEMDPEYPLKYFDDVATDLCTSEKTYMIQEKSRTLQYIIWNVCGRSRFYSKQALRFVGRPEPVVKYHSRAELLVKDPEKRLGHIGADDILAHPFFGGLDRDALAMDQVESPYVPTKDINAAPQRAIGSFADAGSKVSLSREDQAVYNGWEYTSINDFQREVVDFLTYREDHRIGPDSNSGGCCGVS